MTTSKDKKNNWVEHKVQEFLDKLASSGGKPMEQLAPKDARQVLINAQKSVKTNLAGVNVEEKIIKAEGADLKLTIMRPQDSNDMLPCFMFFHGGGWVL